MNLLTILFLLSFSSAINCQEFSRKVSKKEMGLKRQKLSHFHFYFHDKVSGRKPTVVRVAQSAVTNSSATLFGLVAVMDDPLTVGPTMSSRIVGRAQGIYASADMTNDGLLMAFNFAFTDGKFNGSNLSVLGKNAALSAVREMPVVGGSGVFRFARGYAQARTHEYNAESGDAVIEYNVYVFHY